MVRSCSLRTVAISINRNNMATQVLISRNFPNANLSLSLCNPGCITREVNIHGLNHRDCLRGISLRVICTDRTKRQHTAVTTARPPPRWSRTIILPVSTVPSAAWKEPSTLRLTWSSGGGARIDFLVSLGPGGAPFDMYQLNTIFPLSKSACRNCSMISSEST